MNNIHAPTVPSGSSTSTPSSNLDRLSFQQLQQKKDDIEAELQALGSVLDSHGVNMETPLTTNDGFPRADIDVAQVRTTRSRVIHLRNDYKQLMAAIEEHLHRHFASVQDGHAGESEITEGRSTTAQSDLATVFARVNTVAPGGPADRAGLRPGDQIRTFGYANSTNHDNLKKVAECVQANQGRSVLVNVSRSTGDGVREELRLTLVPVQGWGGRGMLGCHLLPI
ncbi:hypothetical protein B0T11DRAFT_228759 [Plectosphaerella cucumerina]|uniref:Probable 26S proteasome regulatory subunit p27 n=1 Tax=Plectosphaerella cucumerina TaxID=40658 RepID=A0A8K0X3S3_9PEZI|nr:hypothetical protein B0T11DRAFT_228759 [Plectosphaerella cucumerina]